jgi:hypothetical protein
MHVELKPESLGGGRRCGSPPELRIRGTASWALPIMLGAVVIRLLSSMPDVPVLHWHGADGLFHVHEGGGLPHEHGGESGDGPQPDERHSGAEGYYSPNSSAVEEADHSQTTQMEQPAGWLHPLWVRVPESVDGVEGLQARAPPQRERTAVL